MHISRCVRSNLSLLGQGATIGTVSVMMVAAALKLNRSLRQLLMELDVSDREGAAAVANALRSNTTITELDMGDSAGEGSEG